jgi:hypothetical protein
MRGGDLLDENSALIKILIRILVAGIKDSASRKS